MGVLGSYAGCRAGCFYQSWPVRSQETFRLFAEDVTFGFRQQSNFSGDI